MPEGPEVRVVAEYLDFYLANVTLKQVTVIGGKFVQKPPSGLSRLHCPLTFESVKSKGKMLIFSFQNTAVKMFVGLGMTGRFDFVRSTHSALRFDLEMPEPFANELFFTDVRRFGNVNITEADLSSHLAPGIFDGITFEEFRTRARKINTLRDVTAVLLDQSAVCAGIGNYLVAEILYRAGISPFRKFKSLTDEELDAIHHWAVQIAHDALRERGTSVSDFFMPDGTSGKYQNFLQVYGKTRTPAGESVRREKGSHGRSIWWVPEVQR